MRRRYRLATALLAAASAFGALPALAHPHVWVDAKAELVFNDKGELSAVRHIWQFDPDFTAFATLNLDANNDGKLTMDELTPLAQTNMDALKEYGYFTDIYVDNKKQGFAKPEEYWLDFHQKRLTLFYTLPLKTPVAIPKSAMIEIGDPEYFVAISFIKGSEVHLENAPKGCRASYQPPHDLDAQTMAVLAAIPADQRDLPPDLVQAASVLTNVIHLDCASGTAPPVAVAKPTSTLTSADIETETAPSQNVLSVPAPPLAAPPQAVALPPEQPPEEPGFWSRLWHGMFK